MTDLFVLCHARQIIDKNIISWYKGKIVNLHPCLSQDPGADPIGRFIKGGTTSASVGCHHITPEIDKGKIITENFIHLNKIESIDQVYNELYPIYVKVMIDVINKYKKHNLKTK